MRKNKHLNFNKSKLKKSVPELLRRHNAFFFIVLLILAISCFWGVTQNQIFNSKSFKENSLIAYTDEALFRPLKKIASKNLNLETVEGLSLLVNIDNNKEKILYAKNIDQPNSLASITKLMTALVAIEQFGLNSQLNIDAKKAAEITALGGDANVLKSATTLNLLHIMLIESNNSAADAFASQLSEGEFVDLMNKKALELGMENTIFYNPSGLDEEDSSLANQSSARDLGKLIVYILKTQPIISKICSISKIDYYIGTSFYKTLKNTNILLEDYPEYLWGKTGYTKTANGCIILVLKKPASYPLTPQNEYLINVILGADGKNDRFIQALKLENWLKDSFIW